MPFDSNTFLRDQGWEGPGRGLRDGALSKPLAPAQKRTLAGLGKDRDEAFPFWDHVYNTAASAIKVHLDDSDEDKDSDLDMTSKQTNALLRTATGIISNKRPVCGISATPSSSASGTSTPASMVSGPTMSVMSVAKREAAKRNLYSRFFRGPLVGPDDYLSQTAEAGPSSPVVATISRTITITGGSETAEERKARKLARRAERAAREARKADRRRRRQERAARTLSATLDDTTAPVISVEVESTRAKVLTKMKLEDGLLSKKKKRHESQVDAQVDDPETVESEKVRKKRRRKEES